MRATAKPLGAMQSFSLGFRALIGLTLAVAFALAVAIPADAAKTHFLEGTVGEGELVAPNGLAVASDGTLYVADPAAGNVRKYDAAGNPSDFGGSGSNALPVNPLAIAVDNSGGLKDGTLYVATSMEGPYEVWAFDSDGEPVTFTAGNVLGNRLRGDSANAFAGILGIAIGSDGSLVIPETLTTKLFAGSGARIALIASERMAPGNLPPRNAGLGIAVDSSGTVLGSDGSLGSFGGELSVYTPSSMPYSESTQWTKDLPGIQNLYGHAVDTANDDLYVNHNSFVGQYESAAEGLIEIGTFGGGDLTEGSNSVAIDRSGGASDGDVYVVSGAKVARFGPTVTVPTATTEPAGDIELGQEAELQGTVDPDGVQVTECRFEYGPDASYGSSVPCEETPAQIGSGSGEVTVHASVPVLAVGNYHFRLVAENANGPSRGADQEFSVIKDPVVEAQSAEPALTEARLRATIDPGNAVTEYRFEFGPTAAYGRATPWESIPKGAAPIEVTASALGLSPAATYHYRVVASSAAGEAAGPDETFTTGAKAPESCPNAAIREAQQVTWLRECRAYEMVSPPEKEGSDVETASFVTGTATGNEIAFASKGGFAGSPSRGLFTSYLARRDNQAWSTEAVDPPTEVAGGVIIQPSRAFSPDLSQTLQASVFALAPGANEGGSNLYLRDNATGRRELVATEAGRELHRAIIGNSLKPFVGASGDWTTVVFTVSETGPLADGALPDVANIYRYRDGDLAIVNRLPDGTPVPARVPGDAVNPISEDGSRVFFQQGENTFGQLYLREGDDTIPISASQRSGEEGEMKQAFFEGATPDGSVVYFQSAAALLDDVENSNLPTLYRYEVETGELTEITPFATESASGVAEVIAMNEEGTYLYILASASLVDGVEPTSFLAANIYVWHEGEIRYIGNTTPGAEEYFNLGGDAVSPDGRYFAFTSYSPVVPESDSRPGCETVEPKPECLDLFVYDFGADGLTCVTCESRDGGGVLLPQNGMNHVTGSPPRAVFDDGVVLLSTPRALLPRDLNGKWDAYMWDEGQFSMLSSGTSRFDAQVLESSADRSSVFIGTAEQLVRQDVDAAVDLYAVRVDGGLAGQEPSAAPPGCEGEACRAGIGSPPTPAGIATLPRAGGGKPPGCQRMQRRAKAAALRAAKLKRRALRAQAGAAADLRKAAIRERKRAKRLTAKANDCGGQH